MRDTVIKYATNLKSRGFQVSQELPFDADGNPLYVKNPKRVYVDQDQVSVESEIKRMSGNDILREVVVVNVYVAVDAKQTSQETSSLIASLTQTKAIDSDNKYFRRSSNVTTEFVNDLLVNSIELRFERIYT